MARVLSFLLLVSACLAASPPAWAETLYVQVREAQLRQAPSFLSPLVSTLGHGDPVNVVEKRPPWLRVTLAGTPVAGWMHDSALAANRPSLSSGDAAAKAGVSSGEVALAGKGFNPETEAAFRDGHADADFASVDAMEQLGIPAPELGTFLAEGKLHPREAAK